MLVVPDEGKSLPPPGIVNGISVWMGGIGWATALLHNAINRRPPMKSGVHRQVLFTTIGWFIGYHLSKYEKYIYAKRDREMYAYINLHPERFDEGDKKTFAEITEPFYPVR